MIYLVSMIVALGLLIFVHELGHFLVAKKNGIGVKKFSLGFGPKIIGRKWGETEYLISALPLGGYVKLEGEEPDEECENPEKSFSRKSPLAKLSVAAAGPIFNIIFAIFILAGIYMSGITVLKAVVGEVDKDSPAWKAGLKFGDEVVKINDTPVASWDELTNIIHVSSGKTLMFTISRDGNLMNKEIIPDQRVITDLLNEQKTIGLVGIKPVALKARIGGVLASSIAEKSGIKDGDTIVSVNGKKVEALSQIEDISTENILSSGKDLSVGIEREKVGKVNDKPEKVEINIPASLLKEATPDASSFPALLGIEPTDLYIDEVVKDSAADKAGLKPFDKIIELNGKSLSNWDEFLEAITKKPGETVKIAVMRKNERIDIAMTLGETTERDMLGDKIKIGILGVASANRYTDIKTEEKKYSIPSAFLNATERTVTLSGLMFKGIGKLVTGQISGKAISGPIAIAKMAGDQAKRGIYEFASFVAFISINLGIINFIPLGTITDGGLIALFLVEGIIRRPINEKLRAVTQYIGLALIALIMGYALYNDFSRYLGDIIDFFRRMIGV
ncbi:MAG: RIP metalloprotease RseP [Candidatus Schekmanbacteria bacterium]|nr:RIP metalloprotease RseP [Candidatus Schekmanbacteria bacterium]